MSDILQLKLTDKESIQKKADILSQPISQINLEKVGGIADLVESFKKMSIQARNIGTCADIFGRMLSDPERPTILLGLAGPLIAAGLRKVIRDMIELGMVDVVVSTGAILYQDYYQSRGGRHFKGTPDADDAELRDLYIDRIYDTYVDEEKFWNFDIEIGRFADQLHPGEYSTREFLHLLGSTISDDDSILASACRRGVPVFCPAINDSSIGIGLTEHYHRMKKQNKKGLIISSIRDNYELTQIVVNSKQTAAFYVAGGVPKNYINDSVVMSYIFGKNTGGHKYAIQLTTDSPHWGGLSGSTLSEAKSWGKVNAEANTCMAFVEPSVSLPLIAGYAIEKKLSQNRKRLQFQWDHDELTKIAVQAGENQAPFTKAAVK